MSAADGARNAVFGVTRSSEDALRPQGSPRARYRGSCMSERDTLPTAATTTSTYLLEGLKDPGNQTIWQQYVDRYRPLLVGYARRLGLARDAEDVAQQILASFCQSYRANKYEREKGRLRDWLFGIARNEIRNWYRRKLPREVCVAGPDSRTEFFAQIEDDNHLETLCERELREAVMRQCLAQVKLEVGDTKFAAFELFASQGVPARQVAEQLGITSNAVFIAKHRILKRIRELLPEMESVW